MALLSSTSRFHTRTVEQVKWIEAIEFVDDFKHLGSAQGGYNEDQEFFGYRAPI